VESHGQAEYADISEAVHQNNQRPISKTSIIPALKTPSQNTNGVRPRSSCPQSLQNSWFTEKEFRGSEVASKCCQPRRVRSKADRHEQDASQPGPLAVRLPREHSVEGRWKQLSATLPTTFRPLVSTKTVCSVLSVGASSHASSADSCGIPCCSLVCKDPSLCCSRNNERRISDDPWTFHLAIAFCGTSQQSATG
jgi:hypothetical protein